VLGGVSMKPGAQVAAAIARDAITQRSLALAGDLKARFPEYTIARDHDVVTATHGDRVVEFRVLPSGVRASLGDFAVTWVDEPGVPPVDSVVQRAWEAGLL
jgi:hypothetical protein